MVLVRWEMVQAPKKLGGLRVGDAMIRNTALLFKWWGPWKDICHLQIKEQHLREKVITGLALEIGDGRWTRFWEDVWLHCGSLKERFPRLFSVSNQCGSVIRDSGFWDGLEWVWNFQWRRELFQWELDLLSQLHEALRPVLQEGMLSEEVTSYSFTKSVWKGLVPPRVELFAWCGVRGYLCLAGSGLFRD
ncbi:uncharacterized protein [Arachis hypogaea]|uniref:uncharacterized protein n=1 Tax=Arachis hypogaea TaxID=3818 RepID=UPI003B22653F